MEDVKFSIQKAHESLTRELVIGLHPVMIWKQNKFICMSWWNEMGGLNTRYKCEGNKGGVFWYEINVREYLNQTRYGEKIESKASSSL